MKRIKLSKTSWLILAAGVFVVVLVGLGLTRSQQMRQQTELNQAMDITETRLEKLEVKSLQRQEAELQQQLDENVIDLEEVKDRLRQTVVSVDVVDELFKIAKYSNVELMVLRTSTISDESLGSIYCMSTKVSGSVTGNTTDILNFIINLNNGLSTGVVQTVGVSIPDESDGGGSSASLSVIVYSYEGE
jgi:hypothetical protein